MIRHAFHTFPVLHLAVRFRTWQDVKLMPCKARRQRLQRMQGVSCLRCTSGCHAVSGKCVMFDGLPV